ncbi:MAG: hypothetical protein K0U24_08910 [Gammaproteobacteria bacterium]|nr:hypothetical protein [Gammaproteobacteria bacterium]MCH9764323.1 hypothetical protein [Gammaproteobacteria bacterium]
MKLIDRIKKELDGANIDTFYVSKEQIQYDLANTLRQQAIEHLAASTAPRAQGFRTDFAYTHDLQPDTTPPEAINTFLEQQAAPAAWATENEAIALAEMYGVNLNIIEVSTDKTKVVEKQPLHVHTAGQYAPTITLKFEHTEKGLGNHWFLEQYKDTKADGNCLYNAFAQGLQEQVLLEQAAINAQEEKLSKFTAQPTQAPISDTEAPSTAGGADEKQQIQDDYKLALKLAREELDPDSPSETKKGELSPDAPSKGP